MTTLVMPDILTDILVEEPIAPEKIVYLQTRAKLRLHDLILRKFDAAKDSPKKTDQATIARRLKQTRSRISQQLSVPGNWTIDSATKLAAAIGGEIDFTWRDFPTDPSKVVGEFLMNHVNKGQQERTQPQPGSSPQQARRR
jgi:hypothetical protein